MWIIVAVVILVLIVVIALMGGQSPTKKRSREEFLKELADFVEGKLEKIPEKDNSFRINFNFEGEEFLIEDIEEQGFNAKTYRFFLRAKVPVKFSLTFTEKEQRATTGKIIIASQIPDEPIKEMPKIYLPDSLKELNVHSNLPNRANEFLQQPEVVRFLREFKNIDDRGFAFIPLRILDGVVSWEFLPSLTGNPSLHRLYGQAAAIEEYLEKILVVIKKLKTLV